MEFGLGLAIFNRGFKNPRLKIARPISTHFNPADKNSRSFCEFSYKKSMNGVLFEFIWTYKYLNYSKLSGLRLFFSISRK